MKRHPGRLLEPYLRFGLVGALTRPYRRRRVRGLRDKSPRYRPEWLYRLDLIAIGERAWISPSVWLNAGGAGRHPANR
jgi:hypothetical protein